jgi:hypothetical protein
MILSFMEGIPSGYFLLIYQISGIIRGFEKVVYPIVQFEG